MILKIAFLLLIFCLLENISIDGVYMNGQMCTPVPTNQAVYEGTQNIIMICGSNPNEVSYRIIPASDSEHIYLITNYSTAVNNYPSLYDVNETGLIIKTAQGNGILPQISTAGLYFMVFNDTRTNGAKLIVVREPPTCGCIGLNSTNYNISCTLTYADVPHEPINAIMTWLRNGVPVGTNTPIRTQPQVPYYVSTATFTLDISDTSNYTCSVTFSNKTSPQFSYTESAAPQFSASCYAPGFSASCLVTTTPNPTTLSTTTSMSIPILVEPLFGPIAGGTHITITSSATFDDISRYIGSTITGVKTVYIGNNLSSTSVLLSNGSSTLDLVAITPSTTEGSIGQPLPIIIEFSPTPFNMTSNKMFTYLPNPHITDLYPNSFIVDGGTMLEVTGRGLSSVAKPVIQLTVIITRAAENGSSSNTTTITKTTRVCTVPPGNDTYMQCPMPPLNLPEDFLRILNMQYDSQYNVTGSRRSKRDIEPGDISIATLRGQNGIDEADIYLGFIFDGYKEYENINNVYPGIQFTYSAAPEINSSNDPIEFDPSKDELIYVKGRSMTRGCRLADYVVHIGNQTCINDDLTDNQLSCRPPKTQPSSTFNDTVYCDQRLSISISIGYKQYQYACITYTDNSRKLALIVGLTVGLGGGAILIAIIIVSILCCRWRKGKTGTDKRDKSAQKNTRRNVEYENGPIQYARNDDPIELGEDAEYMQQSRQSDGYLKQDDN